MEVGHTGRSVGRHPHASLQQAVHTLFVRMYMVYNSDGEPGTFCDMEDLEDTQDFYEYALTGVFNPDAGKIFYSYEGNESVAVGGYKSNT